MQMSGGTTTPSVRVRAIVLGNPGGAGAAVAASLATHGIRHELVESPGEAVIRAERARPAILVVSARDAVEAPALAIALPGRRTIVVRGDEGDRVPAGEGIAAVISAEDVHDEGLLAEAIQQAARAAAGSRRKETMLRWLERESERDALTGLHNRQAFEDALATVCSTARASREPVAVLVMDVLGTKAVNETYGMDAGTQMIRRAATALARCVRLTDVAARIGGDDFGVVLPGASLEEGRRIARRILHQIEQLNETDWAEDIPLAVAFGVAAGAGCEADELFEAALGQLRPHHHLIGVGPWRAYSDDDGPEVA